MMLPQGVRRLFRVDAVGRVGDDVDAELRDHFDRKVAALAAAGWAPAAAREEALRQFGNVAATREALVRLDREREDARRRRDWRGDWWFDVRHALRGMGRSPGVTAAVVLLLALGIGANAAMYGILERLFLRPPAHLAAPEGLHRLWMRQVDRQGAVLTHTSFDMRRLEGLWRDVPALGSIAGFAVATETVGRGQDAQRVSVVAVTGNYFDVLGVRARMGRVLEAGDDVATAAPAAVVSDAFWRRRFGGSASLAGATLTLDDITYTVVGVMPRGFSGADPEAADVWVPVQLFGPAADGPSAWKLGWMGGQSLTLVARRADGVSLATAADQASRSVRATLADYPWRDSAYAVIVGPLLERRGPRALAADARLTLVTGGVSLIVLLVACANVAALQSLRALQRRRELAVRRALGAGAWRITRLLVIESVVNAVLAGVASAVIAWLAARVLSATLLPTSQWASAPVGARVVGFAFAASLLIGLATGAVPAFQSGRRAGAGDLRSGAGAGRRARTSGRAGLLVLQSALSLTLVVGAALMHRSIEALRRLDFGFDRDRLAFITLNHADPQNRTPLSLPAIEVMERRVAMLPEVAAVAQSTTTPMWSSQNVSFRVPGVNLDTLPRRSGFHFQVTTPNYFAVMGQRLRRGRLYTDADVAGSTPVVVVDEQFAAELWPGTDPIGTCFHIGGNSRAGSDGPCHTVIGIVSSANDRRVHRATPPAQYFVPLAQAARHADNGRTLIVRLRGDPGPFVPSALAALRELFPELPRERVRLGAEMFQRQIRRWRVAGGLFAAAAALSLVVAAVGMFSVVAFSARQRRHEFGVRRALGALPWDVARLVLRQALWLILAGLALGTVLALWGGRFVAPLLFEGRSPRDPAAFAIAAAVLLVAAGVAALLPAREAARVDPRQALAAD